ncbi:MAG: polyphenol oxidase family protein [Acidobacteriota bacterium]
MQISRTIKMMQFTKENNKGSTFYFYEYKNIVMGFTEIGSEIEDVGEYLRTDRIVQLEQVHGNTIHFSGNTNGRPDGDGIILNENSVLAVIRTADCVPLFFWSEDGREAGAIHVGWRGLHSGIGINLLNIMKERGINLKELVFFTGPAIEGKCYTVQQDVVDKFKGFNFTDKIFEKTSEGYSMDVTYGIELCLTEHGVPKENINHSWICTFCDPRFPSYRHGDREKRIFNFIKIK